MRIKNIVLCLCGCLCLTACKGKKVDYQEFIKEANSFRSRRKNNKATYSVSYSQEDNWYSEKIKLDLSYTYDAELGWKAEDVNDSSYELLSIFKWDYRDAFLNLDNFLKSAKFLLWSNIYADKEVEESFYINPFGYEAKYETNVTNKYPMIESHYIYYEWDEYGDIVKYVCTTKGEYVKTDDAAINSVVEGRSPTSEEINITFSYE